MKNGTLFIIGNGFDLFHELNTTVEDFKTKLALKDIYNQATNALDVFEGYGVNWGEYENSLSSIEVDIIEEMNLTYPDYFSDRESDRDGTIYDMQEHLDTLSRAVSESLKEMISEANVNAKKSPKRLKNIIKQGDAILSFNYSSTMEQLYAIPNNVDILHLHGLYDNGDQLIFGYKSEEQHGDDDFISKNIQSVKDEFDKLINDGDFYIDSQREAVIEFYKSMKKELKLEELETFLLQNKTILEIKVLGHSMSEVDYEYMEMVEEIINPKTWYISHYNNSPNRNDIKKYSFNSKVHFFSLNELNMI